jgi:hypothetical protein
MHVRLFVFWTSPPKKRRRTYHGLPFPSALTVSLALCVAEKRPCSQLSEKCAILNPPQVDDCIAGQPEHTALVRVSCDSAGKAEVGNGKLNHHISSYVGLRD